jgi:hypothetical protein
VGTGITWLSTAFCSSNNVQFICHFKIDRLLTCEGARRDLPGHRHGKLFIGRPCKKRADDVLKLRRHQLKMVAAIPTVNVYVRRYLNIMGLFKGDPTCRFCSKET